MIVNGRAGYRRYAEQIFATSAAMQAALRSHAELRLLGEPTFLFAFTSDEFDIYHVNDRMKERGWRLNGLQYPNALHMAVTRPQTQPGVVEAFAADLGEAVEYAREHADEPAASAALYGGVPGGMTLEADEFMRTVMTQFLDAMQSVPA
jgi:glutamate/tyrosine decarboxylase-like PLP-dependent enzyme